MGLYRNNDVAFSHLLSGVTARRKLQVEMTFQTTDDGFTLHVSNKEMGVNAETTIIFDHQEARQPQEENIRKQLEKLGNTIFACKEIKIEDKAGKLFIPSSLLTELRRKAIQALEQQLVQKQERPATELAVKKTEGVETVMPKAYKAYPYLYNISNHLSKRFFETQGLKNIQPAFELLPTRNPLVMQCRHCIRFALGYCVKRGGKHPTWKEPLYLRLGDGRRFRLEFNCKECQMNIYAET